MGTVAWKIGKVPDELCRLVERARSFVAFEASVKVVASKVEARAVVHRPFVVSVAGVPVVVLVARRSLRLRYLEAVAAFANELHIDAALVMVLRESWRGSSGEQEP